VAASGIVHGHHAVGTGELRLAVESASAGPIGDGGGNVNVDQRTPPSWVRQRCVELVALAQGAEANPRDADEKTSLVIAHQPRASGERSATSFRRR